MSLPSEYPDNLEGDVPEGDFEATQKSDLTRAKILQRLRREGERSAKQMAHLFGHEGGNKEGIN